MPGTFITPTRRIRTAWVVLLPLLIVLPFDPQWPDFERARRGLVMVLIGLGLPWLRETRVPPLLFVPLFGLAGLSVISAAWARDPLGAFEQGGYLSALVLFSLLAPQGRTQRAFGLGILVALLGTSLYGTLQCLGLEWPAGYTVPDQPVTTLGNTNVAAEWSAVAAPICVALPAGLGLPVVFLAGSYLWANGGLAGLLGFHLGLGVYLLRGTETRRRIALCLLLVAAPALGLVLRPGAADPGTAPGAGTRASREAEWSTTRVRLRLYPAVLRLARHELPIGTGAGNFRVEFPPFRDPEEILISSHGGAFETRVETAHSDPLQVLAELGLPGALCLLMFLLALYRSLQSGRLGTAGLASMLAFLPVTLFRSALWNGPAALAWVAGLALAHEPGRLARMRGLAPVGLLLCLLGVPALLGESHGARFLRAQQKRDLPGVLEALDRAVLLDPFETRWRVLRAQIRRKNRAAIQDSNLEELAEELEEVLERRPNDVDALAELAWLGLDRAELRPRGSRALGRLLAIYPSHRAALELRRDYAELRLALEGLAGKEKRAESRAAARRFLGRHPSHPGAMRLAMEHAFLAGDSREGLALLANLGSTSLVEEKLRQVRARAVESEGERLTALLSLQLQLQGLLNELKKKQ